MSYNYQRIHGSLGMAPIDKLFESIYDVLSGEDVYDSFDPVKERFRERDLDYDQQLAKIKNEIQLPAQS